MVAIAAFSLPLVSIAQTRVEMPKNKYRVQDDVQIGNEYSRKIEQQFPLVNDRDAQDYLERVGQRLVQAVPEQFNQPSFNYRFRWVDASDLNAFALPGGPMYVNRGMMQSARNEGELAGVMAHELSHVALRHATAQHTKQTSAGSTLRTLGLILGGAVLGGNTGAQLGAMFAQGFNLKYSREYESQADTLGAQIMARAGYDPRDLANVFQTIGQQSRGGGGWFSSHPDPGDRYNKIVREASYLPVSNPIKITRDFERIQARFRGMPRARTMAEIERSGGGYNNGGYDNSGGYGSATGGRYSTRVPYPSTRSRTYTAANFLRVDVPSNWQEFAGQNQVTFAPQGAFGSEGITRGVMLGMSAGSGNFQNDTQNYVNSLIQGNTYLRQRTGFSQTYIGNRQGYTTQLSGRSPLTGRTEIVTVYTTQLRNGNVFYAITVVPSDESGSYSYAFRNVLNSIQLND
jgi:Zn-dependent protease with chaperone function